MFFDLSPLEIVVLLGLSVMLFGPDKLPAAAASAARLLRQIRALADDSRAHVREQLGPEFAELRLDQLDPRRLLHEHLGEEVGELRGAFDELRRDVRPTAGEPDARADQNASGAGATSDQYSDAT